MSGRAVQAVVFDLDGVLVDSEPVHLELSRRIVAPAELREEDYARFIGGGGIVRWLSETYGIAPEELRRDFDAAFDAYIAEQSIEPVDGAGELIEAIATRGLALAVASQSDEHGVVRTLRSAGLAQHFPIVASAQHVARGKPAPDVYLRAAELLGADPAACLAVEDSAHGVTAALAAGMTVVQSRQTSHPFPPQPGVAAVVESLRDFDLRWLDGA